jgi:hypothetical protein
MSAPAGHEDPLQVLGVAVQERFADRLIHFVAATTPSGAHGSHQTDTLRRCQPRRPDASFDDPLGQTSPACMDRGDRTSVLRSDQNRNAIRGHDPDAGAGLRADHNVCSWAISCDSRVCVEHGDPMDLDRKHCVFRNLAAALAKAMFDPDIYENMIA